MIAFKVVESINEFEILNKLSIPLIPQQTLLDEHFKCQFVTPQSIQHHSDSILLRERHKQNRQRYCQCLAIYPINDPAAGTH